MHITELVSLTLKMKCRNVSSVVTKGWEGILFSYGGWQKDPVQQCKVAGDPRPHHQSVTRVRYVNKRTLSTSQMSPACNKQPCLLNPSYSFCLSFARLKFISQVITILGLWQFSANMISDGKPSFSTWSVYVQKLPYNTLPVQIHILIEDTLKKDDDSDGCYFIEQLSVPFISTHSKSFFICLCGHYVHNEPVIIQNLYVYIHFAINCLALDT